MTRKQLPKAITRPAENVHAFTGAIITDDVMQEPPPRPVQDRPPQERAPAFDRIKEEPPLAVSSAPIANDSAPAAETQPDLPPHLAAKRRAIAHRIVERHRTYAAIGGLVPVPVANIGAVTAANLRMVQQLSALYQVPFRRDRARAAIVSLIGGAAPSGFGLATSSALMWIIPGGLFVGLGVSALSAGALTRAIGQVFVEGFESGAQLRV
jgi:uncharacterized protein (DUF697 family)